MIKRVERQPPRPPGGIVSEHIGGIAVRHFVQYDRQKNGTQGNGNAEIHFHRYFLAVKQLPPAAFNLPHKAAASALVAKLPAFRR